MLQAPEAVSLVGRQTLTTDYWMETLKILDSDVEQIFSVMLEEEIPLSSFDLVLLLVQERVRNENETWRKKLAEGSLFQPNAAYAIGDKIVFPALDFIVGEVVGTRAGSSPENGEFTVIQVAFDDGIKREFASQLETPHALDLEDKEMSVKNLLAPANIEEIAEEYADDLIPVIEDRLTQEEDAVFVAGMWFLKSLLPEIDQGHLNLAEAVLDMHAGGPLPAEDILPILDLPEEINEELQAFALNYAMYQDRRFDEVGPAGLVTWYLQRLEPEEVQQVPERILYEPILYNRDLLSEESLALEQEIGDEFSLLKRPKKPAEEVTLTLIYPHRLTGTLPLNAHLMAIFPTAYQAERILITFIDGQNGEEFQGWVERKNRYVVGLDRFYRVHKLPIGAYVTVKRTDDPGRFIVDYDAYRPRTEWITLVEPQNGRLNLETQKRSIGAGYDALMVLGTDYIDKVEEIWQQTKKENRGLVQIMRDLFPTLVRLNPQATVHVKTLYSTINVIRRCPPGPILAALEAQPEFEAVGGQYWRFNPDARS